MNSILHLQRAIGNRAVQRLLETGLPAGHSAAAIQRQPKQGTPPAKAKPAYTHCDASDPNLADLATNRTEWQNAVRHASAAKGAVRDLCFVNLIQAALGTAATVRGATNSGSTFAAAAKSYAKMDGDKPVINFDAHLNQQAGVPRSAAGLTRREGDSLYMVFGPNAISADFGPDLTRSTFDHENVHVRQFQGLSKGATPPAEADMEIEAYAEDFTKWFLKLWRVTRPCTTTTELHGAMFDFYEDASDSAKDKAFQVIEKFVRSESKNACSCWKFTQWYDMIRDSQSTSKLGKRMAKELPCIGPIPAKCNPTNPTPCPDQ